MRRRIARLLAVGASALAAVTCDLVTGPTADSGLVVEYTGPAVLTVGQTVDFDFSVLDNTVPIEGTRVRVVSSAPDIIEIQGNEFTPLLFVKARGQATITATLLGSTLGENPPFIAVSIAGVVKAIANDSANVTFRSLADTLRLHAEASDFNNQLIAGAGASARWRTTDAAIVQVDSVSGRITARGNGTAQVIARLDSTADTTQVLVQQRLVRFAFAPVNLVLNALNLDTVVTVTPLDAGGTPLAAGAPAFTTTMTALNAGIASVVRLTNTTLRVSSQGNSATATGVRVVDAVGNVADDTLSVTVGQIAQSMVVTSATQDTVDAFQDTLRVRARAFDARNVEVQARAITWTSTNTSVGTVDQTGLVTGQTGGTVQIQAKMDAATATAAIHMRNTPRSVTLNLDSTRITTINDTIIVVATARNRLGATVAGTAVTWQSLDATIAQVTASGAVIATGVGNTRVIASIAGGYADTLRARVTNDPTSVDIIPPTVTLASIGDTSIPNVTIVNSRGASLGRTTVSWRSADTIVTVNASGVIVARAAGSTFVTATTPDSARADTVLVTVTNAPETVTLNRVLDTLTAPTRTLQYNATVYNARNVPVAGTALNWRSSNASVASVSGAGLVTALAVGQAFIISEATGAAGLRADTARLVVTNDVVSLTVSPTNITVPSVGATATISADPRNAVGASVSGVTPIWTTSDVNVATVDATGTVTGIAVGTATITGNVAGKTASAGVTVTNAPDTISIIPATATLASVNDSVTPPVDFRNALGASLPRSSAQWSSLDGAIAQVTPDGIVIATGRGTTLVSAINALNPARRDSITVTVTNAPNSINVLRTLDSLPSLNRTIQYSADVFNARGDIIVGQAVTWTSRTPSVVTVSNTGLATSVGIGSSWIIGTAGTKSDSALLLVSNRATSVGLTPSSLALTSVGQTATLSAVARNELGNVIASPTVTWSSANPAVATVVGGLVTAVAPGATTVSATVDGVTASASVTVSDNPTTVQFTSGNLTLASIGDQATPSITITNSLGTVLPRSAVTWSSSNANTAIVSGSGVITAVAAGAVTITATSPSNGAVTSSIIVTVTNAPVTLSIAPAGTTTLTALGATVTLVATVRNAAGAVIASPSPAVTWSSNNAAVGINPSTGVATAVSVGSATITATAGAATGAATATVAPVPSAGQSTIATSAATLTANGLAQATITVQLRDANANIVTTGGWTVTLALAGTGTLSAVTNNGNGNFTATLTAPTATGSASIGAAFNGTGITSGDPVVTFAPGTATKYIVTASSASPVAGTGVTMSAQLADAFNNPVPTPAPGSTRTVTWSATGGGSFVSGSTTTNASGVATATFNTSTTAQTLHTVTANDGSVSGTSGAIQTIAGAPAAYTVAASNANPAAGSNVTITAQLTDANGNAVGQARTVNWSVSGAGGTLSAPSSGTNGSGVATVTLTVSSTPTTVHQVTATDNANGAITGTSGAITVGGAATKYLVTSSGSNPQAGSPVTITAQLADASNNPVALAGQTVTWSKTGTGGSFASAFSITNSSGVAQVVFTTSTTSGTTHTVTATDNLALTGTSANIVTAAGPATQLVFTTQPPVTALTAAGFGAVVTARDANNNTASGFNGNVALTITSGTGTAGAVLGGTTTLAAVNGVATFSGLTIDRSGSNYRLTATTTSPALTVNSNQVDVNNPSPTLTSLGTTSGNRLDTLAVVFTGTGFISNPVTTTSVNFGANITVDSVRVTSGTSLTAYIRIGSTAATGARNVSVTNAAPGGGTSGNQSFTVNNPAPTLTSLGTTSGNRLDTLAVALTGTKFIQGVTTASFGSNIIVDSTVVSSATSATAYIRILSTAATGARTASVTNAAPGGGTSGTQAFTVNNPAPTLTNAAPASAVQGQAGLDVVLTGTNFISGTSAVSFSNAGITVNTTTVNSATQITVNISVTAGASTGAGTVSVTNAGPGGGTSGTQTFTVNAPPAPTLASVAPTAGNRLQTLNVVFAGTGFVQGVSSVNVGADITVNSVTVTGATSLTANITIAATAATGARNFSVTNTPAGGTSADQTFTVNNPAPTLSGLSPTSGDRLGTLDVVLTGTGFIQGTSSVNVGADITVNSVTVTSATSLTANITIASTAATGARNFSVTNSGPGGGTSGNQSFTVNNPAPTLTSLNPTNVDPGTTLDVVLTGTGFINGVSSVAITRPGGGGVGITLNTTTVNSDTQITINITVSGGAAQGNRTVTVSNGPPGGGSAAQTLVVNP